MIKVFVMLANGFEEIEGLTVVDLLRRANIEVVMVSIEDTKRIVGSHNIVVEADALFEQVKDDSVNMVVLPGGMPGSNRLREHSGLRHMILARDESKEYLAAICAAPSIFAQLGILKGRDAVCHPTVEDQLKGANLCHNKVIRDGHIITSRGMGTSIDFAAEIIKVLMDEDTASGILKSIIYM